MLPYYITLNSRGRGSLLFTAYMDRTHLSIAPILFNVTVSICIPEVLIFFGGRPKVSHKSLRLGMCVFG